MADFKITSDAFANGEDIPRRYTCEGEDVSPPLRWSGAPEGAQSAALIVDDPDAPVGTFTHWVAWGFDAETTLAEGEAAPAEGRNDFGNAGYGGPCPPPGHGRHRYVFRVFALSGEPRPESEAGRDGLVRALDGLVLGVTELVGGYER